ncbi:MAG: D-glycero-beta-D-manno-heptose 1-phosphate adenylyltransferase [Zetaproteobacteria bacterium]|nr:MAG: D-glycero-beta-D-manno-heptose 1-phosphate adenylyltransferase [Zetaproteobacteria bacterium]
MRDAAPLLSWDEAEARCRRWRAEGRRVVFTNGCFDLLHPGHVTYLAAARALGERLIVGLNDDASVRGLKGPERPIQPQEARACLLAALRSVDAVVLFSQPTPLQLIRRLRPDLLVKGGDYDRSRIVGADEVEGWGGSVHVIPFVGGCSTSALIARIRGRAA